MMIGADVGGTFTDFVVVGPEGFAATKLPSTPHAPELAVLDGLSGLDPGRGARVRHGTTVATNALLEGRGARTAFVTTEGFADLLEIGRGARRDLYALEPAAALPPLPRELRFEARERIGASGNVERRLTAAEAKRVAAAVARVGPEAAAVCLLFSFLDNEHEEMVGQALADAGVGHVSLSSRVLPVFREVERAATVMVNAMVAPAMSRYLARLAAGAAPRTMTVMASHGGTLSPALAASLPAATILSGPAAGVQGAAMVARRAGFPKVITFDMGGTSADVALVDGDLTFSAQAEVAGWPVHLPALAIDAVGAGGGSIVRADAGGSLRVGPESAGAEPGPAAYGRGGRLPTVTDAHVLLGRLPPAVPLAGGLRLDEGLAHSAFADVAGELGMTVEAAAAGAIQVVNANMERVLRRVSVAAGHDPGDFMLTAFGGAGPLHACELADAIGAKGVVVPGLPGALSALGLALASPRATASRSVLALRGGALRVPPAEYLDLEAEARRLLDDEATAVIDRFADARYVGQSWEIQVPWPPGGDVRAAFEAAHQARYGYVRDDADIEVVTLRVRASGETTGLLAVRPVLGRRGLPKASMGHGPLAAVIVPRWSLVPGEKVAGPAVITQEDATTYVPESWVASVGVWGDLILRRRT